MHNKNLLGFEDPERYIIATLESSPNKHLPYPIYGKVWVSEFDVSGNPLVVGFKPYCSDGTFGTTVSLGHVRDCEWRNGFRDGAKVYVKKL